MEPSVTPSPSPNHRHAPMIELCPDLSDDKRAELDPSYREQILDLQGTLLALEDAGTREPVALALAIAESYAHEPSSTERTSALIMILLCCLKQRASFRSCVEGHITAQVQRRCVELMLI